MIFPVDAQARVLISKQQEGEMEDRKARRKRKNAEYQATYRKKQRAHGLVQAPAYVSLDSRPEMWKLQQAFMYEPNLVFDPTLGSLRDYRTGRFTSPVRVIERHQN